VVELRLESVIHGESCLAEPGFWFYLAMWLGMTAVMMTPVVWPWLRALSKHEGQRASVPVFAVGYGSAWVGFSTVMTLLHIMLTRLDVPPPLTATAPTLAGGALLVTGAFQFTKLKEACLSHCRSPFGYFAAHWQSGLGGALSMGLRHGIFCLGCCWAVMALALVVGMMDVRMMAALMAVMLLETSSPFGARLTRPVGAVLILWGAGLILA
jgi:predicted metal-binding membrane protein